jgi:hypothetical protein
MVTSHRNRSPNIALVAPSPAHICRTALLNLALPRPAQQLLPTPFNICAARDPQPSQRLCALAIVHSTSIFLSHITPLLLNCRLTPSITAIYAALAGLYYRTISIARSPAPGYRGTTSQQSHRHTAGYLRQHRATGGDCHGARSSALPSSLKC